MSIEQTIFESSLIHVSSRGCQDSTAMSFAVCVLSKVAAPCDISEDTLTLPDAFFVVSDVAITRAVVESSKPIEEPVFEFANIMAFIRDSKGSISMVFPFYELPDIRDAGILNEGAIAFRQIVEEFTLVFVAV